MGASNSTPVTPTSTTPTTPLPPVAANAVRIFIQGDGYHDYQVGSYTFPPNTYISEVVMGTNACANISYNNQSFISNSCNITASYGSKPFQANQLTVYLKSSGPRADQLAAVNTSGLSNIPWIGIIILVIILLIILFLVKGHHA